MSDEAGGSGDRGRPHGGTIHPMKRTVLVDGNNVMGSRPDGWWRNRAGAAERLVAEIAPLARSSGGAWTIVFDGPAPPGMVSPHEGLAVVHAGRARRDDAGRSDRGAGGSPSGSGGGTGLQPRTRGCVPGYMRWAPRLRAPGRSSMRSRPSTTTEPGSGALSTSAARGAGRVTHTKRSPQDPARFRFRWLLALLTPRLRVPPSARTRCRSSSA